MNRLLLLVLCCVMALATVAGCSLGGADPAALLAAAQRHQGKGEHSAAIIELRNLLALEPDNVEARLLLASSYGANGQHAAAEDELRKAIQQGLEPRRVSAQLGRALLLQGKYERLLEEIEPAPDIAAEDAAKVNILRGLAHLGLGRLDDARRLLERVDQKDARNSEALLGLAAIAAAEDRTDEAAKLIDRAVELDPANAETWIARGDFNRARGKAEQAVEDYSKALALKPGDANVNLQLALLYAEQQRFDEARKRVDAVRARLADNPSVNYLDALIAFRNKSYAAAEKAIDQALRKQPNHVPSLLLAGSIHYASGNYDKAMERLRAVLDRAPGSVAAQRMLAAAMLRSGQVQRSIALLEQALATAQNDAGLLGLLAEAHIQNDDLARALPLLERIAKADPENRDAHQRLQIARLLGGQSGAVLADLEASMKQDEASPMAELLYAVTLVQGRQFDRALEAIAELEKKQKTPISFNLKAAALIGKGKPDEARKALENALALNPRFTIALINLARLDLREQGPHAARKRLESFLQREPNNVQVLTTLAQMGPQLGAPADLVIEWLERARAADPRSVRQVLLLAEAHLRTGDATKALQYAEQAQKMNADQAGVLEMLGEAQFALGQTGEALGTFSKLALQHPKSPSALYRLARVQAASNNSAGAALTLQRALELAPRFAAAMSLLGQIQLNAGRKEAALELAQELQRAHPRLADGYELQGDVHRARKEFARAAEAYAQARTRGNRSAALAIKTHMALKESGRAKDADAFLRRFEADNPEEIAVQAYLGDQDLSAGRYAAAFERYQAVLKRQPQNALVLNNLAWAAYQLKNSRAHEFAEKANALRPDNPVILDTLGWLLVESGQSERGIDLLQRAVTLAPDAAETRYHLAQAFVKAGNFSQARKELESLLAGNARFENEAQARALLSRLR